MYLEQNMHPFRSFLLNPPCKHPSPPAGPPPSQPEPRPLTKPNPTVRIPRPSHRCLPPALSIAIPPTTTTNTTSSASTRRPRRESYPHLGRPRTLHAGDGRNGRRHRPGLLLLDVICPALDPGLHWWWRWRSGVHTLSSWLLWRLRLSVVGNWVRGLVWLCGCRWR
jgi:hypothetical protein